MVVTLDLGRGKRRLRDVERTRVLEGLLQGKRRLRDVERTRILEGLLQGDVGWGLPQQVFSNDRLRKMVQGLYKEAYTRE